MLHGPTDAELVSRAKTGDREAADTLILRHTAMAVSLAKRTGYRGADLDDLVQEGLIGIAKAINGWSPTAGSKFTTYAFMVVRNQVSGAVSKMKRDESVARPADLHEVYQPEPSTPDIAGLLDRLTELERCLVALLYGLDGPAVGIGTAARRYGLTPAQAAQIVESAFLRVRRQSGGVG